MQERELTIIRGDHALSVLRELDKKDNIGLVFRGDSLARKTIEPLPAFWERDGVRYADSDEPVVCAAKDPLVPVFMAIVPRTPPLAGYQNNNKGGISFYLDESLSEGFENGTGYVAVIEDNEAHGFEDFDMKIPEGWPTHVIARLPERRTKKSVDPIFHVEVSHNTFKVLFNANKKNYLLPYR